AVHDPERRAHRAARDRAGRQGRARRGRHARRHRAWCGRLWLDGQVAMAARGHKPTKRGNPPPPIEFSEDAPTSIYESGDDRGTPTPPPEPPKIQAISMKTPADPKIQAISMKTPADPSIKPIAKLEREMPHVKLRAMS